MIEEVLSFRLKQFAPPSLSPAVSVYPRRSYHGTPGESRNKNLLRVFAPLRNRTSIAA